MTKQLIFFNEEMKQPEPAVEKEKAPDKNKGGRPKDKPKYANCKLNIYLSENEYKLFKEFTEEGWHDKNASGVGRYLLLFALHVWAKKGRKKVLST